MRRSLNRSCPHRLPLDRLCPSPRPGVRQEPIDWTTPIDRSRRFYCDTLTPLYYTRVYAELGDAHRLRYNQLTGLYSNELIGFLETRLLARTLDALIGRADLGLPDALTAALREFRRDEQGHADEWRRLNRLSEPAWYARDDYRILAVGRFARAVASFVASHPVAFPLVFWFQLVQEERSVDISRRLAAAAEYIEPRYVAVYRNHLRDEVRHVQIDWHLIDHLFARRRPLWRRLNARLFRHIVGTLFLAPAAATARIVRLLVRECPELGPLEPRMRAELAVLGGNEAYCSMMYSRETTPVTFALFDRYPEFHPMREPLKSYQPRLLGSQP